MAGILVGAVHSTGCQSSRFTLPAVADEPGSAAEAVHATFNYQEERGAAAQTSINPFAKRVRIEN